MFSLLRCATLFGFGVKYSFFFKLRTAQPLWQQPRQQQQQRQRQQQPEQQQPKIDREVRKAP